ncbi:MAG: phosphoadenylyl-sulfate reductase [Rhodobacteraceae bacterium]|nr:phosphoadenylyl-sulfate reductase [Paracoccaceae bacterium]
MFDLAKALPDPVPEQSGDTLNIRVATLNARYRHHSATDVLNGALRDAGTIALVSAFGAESVVLLHMTALIAPATPVLFIDTQMLFPETLAYQQKLCAWLGLGNLTTVRAGNIAQIDPDGLLPKHDPDACCHLRKFAPLQLALAPFDGWITGRKRFQSGTRAQLDFFEAEPGAGRIKVNPLAHWAPIDVQTYMQENALPRHPLVAHGFASIGCAPCTTPVKPGEDPRAGRWRKSNKDECGLHFVNGAAVRGKVER